MVNVKAGDFLDLAEAVLQRVPVDKELLRQLYTDTGRVHGKSEI